MIDLWCPMRFATGNRYSCQKENCAWWDEKNKQCCIKTFMLTKKEDKKI